MTDARGSANPSATDPAVSIELCGGTHVARTGEIGPFLIVAEEAASAGVRRLEALTGRAAVAHVQQLRAAIGATARALGAKPDELEARVDKLQADLKATQREVAQLRDRLAASQAGGPAEAVEVAGVRIATLALDGLDAVALRNAADALMERSGVDLVVVGSGLLLVVKASEAARARGAQAGRVVKALAERGGGSGGGRPDMAQAGVKSPDGLRTAIAAVPEVLAQVVRG